MSRRFDDDEDAGSGSGSEGGSVSDMFFDAKSKGVSDESYTDWEAIVKKECNSKRRRLSATTNNFSFKATKRLFRIELARGNFDQAKSTFKRLVSFIPNTAPDIVCKAFLNRNYKNLLHIVCPKLNRVPYIRRREAIEKNDAEIQFIVSLHEDLLAAVEAKRGGLRNVWKACSLNLAKLKCCQGEYGAALDIICGRGGLFSLYRDEAGQDVPGSASNLIELYAFTVSIYCDRKEWHSLKANLERLEAIMPYVVRNGIDIALIRECEGVMYSEMKMWNAAFRKFHESFVNFFDCNHEKKIDVLLTCMAVGCFADRSSAEAEKAGMLAETPDVKLLIQAEDHISNFNDLTKHFRVHNMYAFQAALRGPAQQAVSADPFSSTIVRDFFHLLPRHPVLADLDARPASSLAGHQTHAELAAHFLFCLASRISVGRWEAMFGRGSPSQDPSHQWRVIGIDIEANRRRDLLCKGALFEELVLKLLRLRENRNSRHSLQMSRSILSRRHLFVNTIHNQAISFFEEGQKFWNTKGFSYAAKCWARAVMLGHAASHAFLSDLFFYGGNVVAKNETQAFQLALAGAELGCVHSKGKLGECYIHAVGVLQDEQRGFSLGKKSEEAGSCFGQNVVGWCFHRGVCVVRDDAEAVRLFLLAADQGHAAAQTNLGNMFQNGLGVAQSPAKALKWYSRAAAQGHTGAIVALDEREKEEAAREDARSRFNLGNRFFYGRDVPQSYEEAARLYQIAAAQGHGEAQISLGSMYEKGLGVARNLAEAVRFYRLAAAQGHVEARREAQFSLGCMYEKGLGVARDYVEAVRFYRLAEAQGHVESRYSLAGLLHYIQVLEDVAQGLAHAEFDLAQMFRYGKRVDQDIGEEVRLLHLAAAKGHADAQNELGNLFRTGRGVLQDEAEALRLYRLAAAQGHDSAQNSMGDMFQYGRGVEQDFEEAAAWYRLAAQQGHPVAIETLNRLSSIESSPREQSNGQAAAKATQVQAPKHQTARCKGGSLENVDGDDNSGDCNSADAV